MTRGRSSKPSPGELSRAIKSDCRDLLARRRRRFLVTLEIEVGLDDALVKDVLTDEWASRFYSLRTAEDVAGHLAFNLIQGRKLSSLDGFADQPENRAEIGDVEVVDAQASPSSAADDSLVKATDGGRVTDEEARQISVSAVRKIWMSIRGIVDMSGSTGGASINRSFQRWLATPEGEAAVRERMSLGFGWVPVGDGGYWVSWTPPAASKSRTRSG